MPVESTRCNLIVHGSAMLDAPKDTPAAEGAVEQAIGFPRDHLAADG